MTEDIFLKAKVLYDKIYNLEIQKHILSNNGNIIDISIRKNNWYLSTSFEHIDYRHLDSNKLKEFILNEINEKLSKLKKEFNEL